MNRRQPSIERRPDGTLRDNAVLRDLLSEWDRRAEAARARVPRLSKQDGPDKLPELGR